MIKRMIIMLIAVGVLLGLIFGFQAFKAKMIKQYIGGMANQPQTVSTIKAEESAWQPYLQSVGSLQAVKGADLSSEVAGIVEQINFTSGQDVKAGDLLVRLRAEDDIAKLHSLQALADLASVTYQRDLKQFRAQAVSQATVDADAANLKSDQAQAAEQQAVVDKKMIRAPFSGRLGIRSANVGQYLSPGTAIVTLQALDPIYVDFFVPQQALSEIKVGQPVIVHTDTYPKETFDGKISALNAEVDQQSRNIQVRATLPNHDHKLLPGMFATVEIVTSAPQRYVTLPQTAITYNPYGDTVFILKSAKAPKGGTHLVAEQVFVVTGATRGDQVAIVSGLKAGETVVTTGQMKLRNGVPVVVNNKVQPTNEAQPKPKDD
mgnify:CR=1 FL=1